jgi:hypothetical protein
LNELLDGADTSQSSAGYLRRLARTMKAIPIIRSGGDTQGMPKPATLFKFRTANIAAATRKMIPIKRRILGDKTRPPSDS